MEIEEELNLKAIRWVEAKLKQFWWVIAFAIFCLFLFEQGQKETQKEYNALLKKFEFLISQKEAALTEKERKIRQINSQSDHDWIELTLMRGLGLVPDGQKKIFFKNQ